MQTTHASVYQRKTRIAGFPGFDHLLILRIGQRLVSAVDEIGFIATLYFELLDEVTMPFQAGQYCGVGAFVVRIVLVMLDELISLFDRDVSPGQIRREPTTRGSAFCRFGDVPTVIQTATVHEIMQHLPGLRFATR